MRSGEKEWLSWGGGKKRGGRSGCSGSLKTSECALRREHGKKGKKVPETCHSRTQRRRSGSRKEDQTKGRKMDRPNDIQGEPILVNDRLEEEKKTESRFGI